MIRVYLRRLLGVMSKYSLWLPVGTAAVCMIVYKRVISGMDPYDSFYEMYKFSTRSLFVILWCIANFVYMREVIYHRKTGRIYMFDRMKYDRNFFQLVDYYKDANPYRIDPDSLPKEAWQHSEGIMLGGFEGRLLKRSAFENGGEGVNIGVFGRPGTGKTAAELITTALVYGGSVFAIDIKGDILNATKSHRKIKIFSPDNPEESCHYNPMSAIYEMVEDDDKIEFIERIAAILVPEEREKYWFQTGRALFCGISFIMLDQNPRATLPDIARAILKGSSTEWISIIRDSDCELAQLYTNTLFKSSETNLQGAYGSLANVVRPFATGKMARLLNDSGVVISPADLDAGYDIYVEIPQKKIHSYSYITTIIVQQFMDAFLGRPDKSSHIKQQPVLFMLDEFPQLHFDFDTISSALSTLRSKCVSVMMAMQSIAQLSKCYDDRACEQIVDSCSYFTILSAQDPKSRKFFQDLIGDRKVLKSTGNGSQEDREPIFQAADFSNLGDNVIIYALGQYILAEKMYWFK